MDGVRWWCGEVAYRYGSMHVPRTRTGVVWLRGWGGANGFEIAEACARVALCVTRDGVEEVTYDLHDEFWSSLRHSYGLNTNKNDLF